MTNFTHSHNNKTAGFTLIEMLVSLALFTIVSTVTVGALLSLIGGSQRLMKQQTLTSSAIWSLDNMTREIRTGNYYYCGDSDASKDVEDIADCASGNKAMSFVESSTRSSSGGRVAYYFAKDPSLTGEPGSLWRKIGTDLATKLLPDDVVVDISRSRFFVTGSETLTKNNTDTEQPTVTIIMVLAETAETASTTFQTTITQRSLDI